MVFVERESMRIGKDNIRRVRVDERYSVTDDGTVWSRVGGVDLPLEPIGGVGVNLHGRRVKICYLVARAFVANGECREFVRHKNGDVRDNRASNLEWCDEDGEKRKAGRPSMQRWIKARKQGSGDLAGVWSSVAEAAAETGALPWQIRACLYGKRKLAGGLFWEYE